MNAANAELAQRRTQHGVTRVKVEEAGARREQLRAESEDIAGQIDQEQTRLTATREELVAVEIAREGQAVVREDLQRARERAQTEVSAARERARESRDRYHALNVEKESLQTRLGASETARDRLLAQRKTLDEQREELEAGIRNSTTPLPELQQQLESQLADRVAVEAQLAEIREAMEDADSAVREFETERHGFETTVNGVRESLGEARVAREGLAVQEKNLLEQLGATGLGYDAVQAALPEEADVKVWTEDLERLQRRIARLGPINLAAIEEYEQESERKVYLDAQAQDLEQAMDTLLDAIKKIDRETRVRFKDTFDAVNSRLGELFPKVFGGGHAYLELTGEDLLDTGVSLMARPPGKRNASVHLLSGGEKAMTAVALIFAIFHLNPSPVCLLDEVDAPLDDANVSRFASLIEEMSHDVQFLVITHNKITMEMADFLMGVTMQEPGVSRMVSVDVDEAAAMAVS